MASSKGCPEIENMDEMRRQKTGLILQITFTENFNNKRTLNVEIDQKCPTYFLLLYHMSLLDI